MTICADDAVCGSPCAESGVDLNCATKMPNSDPVIQHVPAIPIRRLLLRALPWLSPRSKAIVQFIGDQAPGRVSSNEVCLALNLKSRFVLGRALTTDGLPAFVELSSWIRLLWHCQWAESGRSTLGGHELSNGRDPAIVYRLIKRLTGRTWREVRSLGPGWVLEELAARCRPPGVRPPPPPHRQGLRFGLIYAR